MPPYSLKICFGGFAIIGAASSVDSFTSWFSNWGTTFVLSTFVLTCATLILNLFYQYYKKIKDTDKIRGNVSGLQTQSTKDAETIKKLTDNYQKNTAILKYVITEIPPNKLETVNKTINLLSAVEEITNVERNENSKNNK